MNVSKLNAFQLKALFIGVTLLILLYIGWLKAYKLQITEGQKLSDLSENRYLRSLSYDAARGNIYDRNGILLATTTPLYSIYAEPKRLESAWVAARKINQILPELKPKLLNKLSSNRNFVWVKRRINPKDAKKIRDLNLSGIGLLEESRRHYPNYDLASQTLGLVNIDEQGVSGFEYYMDEELTGRPWKGLMYQDALGRRVHPFIAPERKDIAGDGILLTIDAKLQAVTEHHLEEAIKQYEAKGAWAITMDPNSGEILALAIVPQDNPNHPRSSHANYRRNNILSAATEPGSLIKMATFASLIEHELLDMDERIDTENGIYNLHEFVVRDVTKRDFLKPSGIFKYSSNIGTLKLASRLDKNTMRNDFDRFGFGRSPGLGWREESSGKVPQVDDLGPVEFATLSYGYGLTATPLQLVRFASAIANNGLMPTPQLVASYPRHRRVLKRKTAKLLRDLMGEVTGHEGTAKLAQIQNIETAGKTGTTEKWNAAKQKYDAKRHTASFIGFAPKDNAKYVTMVVIDEPSRGRFGGQVAAPVWKKIMTYAIFGR